ncbi:MAG: hypothetical protein JWR44_3812 [Hymenobacter sp.]|jgi:hypothetical protein|nr:hypothetical protein [Hymenobacter sp.]
MFRNALLFAGLLALLTSAEASAAPTAGVPRGKVLAGNHRPVYTRYGHHGFSRSGLFNLFRPNGSGIAKKVHFKGKGGKRHRGTL